MANMRELGLEKVSDNGNVIYVYKNIPETFPEIRELITNPEGFLDFIMSVTLNPRRYNKPIYKTRFNKKTFIFAFAYQLGKIQSGKPYLGQFEANARRLLLTARGANAIEQTVIEYATKYSKTDLRASEWEEISENLIVNLKQFYL